MTVSKSPRRARMLRSIGVGSGAGIGFALSWLGGSALLRGSRKSGPLPSGELSAEVREAVRLLAAEFARGGTPLADERIKRRRLDEALGKAAAAAKARLGVRARDRA